jgi:hypothetical protein
MKDRGGSGGVRGLARASLFVCAALGAGRATFASGATEETPAKTAAKEKPGIENPGAEKSGATEKAGAEKSGTKEKSGAGEKPGATERPGATGTSGATDTSRTTEKKRGADKAGTSEKSGASEKPGPAEKPGAIESSDAADTPGAGAKPGPAAEELRRAGALRRGPQGQDPEERARTRASSVAAYRAVRTHFPADTAACAEAAFRAAELLRADGEIDEARAEFTLARDLGARTPFRVRALLELGHLERRGDTRDAALAAYEAVLADPSASRGQRDEASLWIGRVHHDAGRIEDARRAWQRVADGAEDPLDRVRAWDALAGILIDAGDLEGAAGALERCRESVADVAAEETRLGERVRNALSSMRSQDELARAVAERARERRDEPRDKRGD